ncbi:hypothetical protein ANN_08460 [Periplaneta americana]|uniref:Uncharacterized protein n=1 Tax=Periplaneta americana TaxID=6978 RepID=A0ABQ8T1I2_PERAM|nr:hypothetical protein ANN_08460 [Periplaneta americana]
MSRLQLRVLSKLIRIIYYTTDSANVAECAKNQLITHGVIAEYNREFKRNTASNMQKTKKEREIEKGEGSGSEIIAPGIPLPPQPFLIRWRTWLNAVNYYAEHYGKIMEVIDALDSTNSSAVAAVKSLPSEQLLKDILFIDSNFKIVSKSITLLESSKLQLSEALNIKYHKPLSKITIHLISEKAKCKLRNIIAKNSAYSQLRIINDVPSGHDKTSEVGVLKSSDFPFFKYVRITSCVVEHTFSQYKNCLSDHRRRFTLQSLKIKIRSESGNRTRGIIPRPSEWKNALKSQTQYTVFRSLITSLNDIMCVRSHTTAELWREVTDQYQLSEDRFEPHKYHQ